MLSISKEEFFIRINMLSEYLFSIAYNKAYTKKELPKMKKRIEAELSEYFLQFPEMQKFLKVLEEDCLQYEYENQLQLHFQHTYKQDDYRYHSRLKKAYFLTKHALNYEKLINLL